MFRRHGIILLHPEFAKFLVETGINSISISLDSFVAVKRQVIASEQTSAGAFLHEMALE